MTAPTFLRWRGVELERLAKERKARPAWFTEACTSLARTLRRGIG